MSDVPRAAISIRPPEPSDAPALVEAARESTADVYPWLPWCRPDYSLADARRWIGKAAEGRAARTTFEFIILDSAGRLLGCCALNGVNAEHRFANLGYWIRSSAAGNGHAVRAVALLRDWGFANTDLERLEIVIQVGNRRSERVAEKIGAQREGVLRSRLQYLGKPCDATMYSLTRPRRATPS